MSTHPETIGIGGAGNAKMNVNHGIERPEPGHPSYETNVGGRGGDGNIGTGPGHYDVSGGRDGETNLMGRGGAGNVTETGTQGHPHTVQKVTLVDKVVGSTQVAIGKVTKNPALVEKGTERKVEGSEHHGPLPVPGSHGTQIMEPGPSAELKNRAI